MFIAKKFAALAIVAAAFTSASASASYLTYTSTVAFSNPTSSSGTASVTMGATKASFQTDDVGGDGQYNHFEIVYKNSTAPNNASGTGTNIGMGTPTAFGSEPGVSQNVGFDFAINYNFTEFADPLKTIQTGTGTAVVNGHFSGLLGDGASTLSATFNPTAVDFSTATSTYRLNNFGFVTGNEVAGGSSAHIQAVPEPTSIAALAGAATMLLRRRRAK